MIEVHEAVGVILIVIGVIPVLISSFLTYYKAVKDKEVSKKEMYFFDYIGFIYMFKYTVPRILAIIGLLFIILGIVIYNINNINAIHGLIT